MVKIAILGAGMAGFGAASRFSSEGAKSIIFEKNDYFGGHTATNFVDGFTFDEGPHISFTTNKRIQDLFAANINNEYETLQAKVNNYWQGYWVKHPAQCNLHGLPLELVVSVIEDFVQAQKESSGQIDNYQDWLFATYGETFARSFPMQYGVKFHTVEAAKMATDWIGPRMYKPDLKQVLNGALSSTTEDVHYVDHFRYPTRGGFVAYLNPFAQQSKIKLSHELQELDPVKKELYFTNGKTFSYDYVVSSLPLPELIKMVVGAPEKVRKAAQKLACTMCVVITIGIDRADISNAYWSYFYDRDYVYTRLSFPHMQSPHNVPSGAGSIQAELYFSTKYKPLEREPEDYIEPVIADLRRCGLVKPADEIIFKHAKVIDYANIIFDLERQPALQIIREYLAEVGIFSCGRYGLWGYHWTDQSFMSGESAAQKVLSILAPRVSIDPP